MKRFTKFSVLAMIIAVAFFAFQNVDALAQNGNHGNQFVDENGDGYNDNAPDHDGDGIPNGQDPDWVKPADGSGSKFGLNRGPKAGSPGSRFVDEDGDGICDNFQDADGDGVPNYKDPDWVKPQDGTGNKFGQKAGNRRGNNGREAWGNGSGKGAGNGSGECDGTGPKGTANKARNNASKAK